MRRKTRSLFEECGTSALEMDSFGNVAINRIMPRAARQAETERLSKSGLRIRVMVDWCHGDRGRERQKGLAAFASSTLEKVRKS